MTALSNRRRILQPENVDAAVQPVTTSDSSTSNNRRGMHRRVAELKRPQPCLARQDSLRRNIEHVAAETYLVSRLAFTLLRYLGIGYRWITQLLALGCYAMLLIPGFIQVAYYYFFSSKVKRSIVYGDQPRNRLDLYLPAKLGDEPKPVLIFVTGGAWIIGYKAWGSLLGLQLAERGIIVACIDYREFPSSSTTANYGGDPNRIYLMGQSAGAHISSCALLEQATRESRKENSVTWSISQIKAYLGLSGGYNLLDLVDHFHNRGLYRSIFLSTMEGKESLKRFSPELKIQDPYLKSSIPHFPPVYMVHGTADYSIPSVASERFAKALKKAGVKTELILYEGKTHTDLFLQVISDAISIFCSLKNTDSNAIFFNLAFHGGSLWQGFK